MERPACYNRPEYHSNLIVRDGRQKNIIFSPIGIPITFYTPRFKGIKNVMSKECQQNEEYGAAKMYNWNCKGCNHYKE